MAEKVKDSKRMELICEFIKSGKQPDGFIITETKNGKYRLTKTKTEKEVLEAKRQRLQKAIDNIDNEFDEKQNNEMVDAKDFNNLTEYVYNLCNKAIDEILSGFITPKPSKNGDKTPCNYCKLRNVCGLKEYEDSFVRKMDKDLSYSEIANIIGGKSEANA